MIIRYLYIKLSYFTKPVQFLFHLNVKHYKKLGKNILDLQKIELREETFISYCQGDIDNL